MIRTGLATTSGAGPWEYHAHPDAWLLVASVVGAYVAAVLVVGPKRTAAGAVVGRRHVVLFALSVALLWAFSDWPIHDLSEGYLFSVHMVQHTMFSLVIPPLLLLAMPPWMLRFVLSPPKLHAAVRKLCRPLPAALLFNGVVAISHWPAWVDVTLRSELAHFLAHALLFTVSLVMWLPVVNKLPDLPTLSAPAKMLYLFLQSIVPTVPAAFLAFAEGPVYRFYASVPRVWGMSVVEDQQLAGAIMKVGGTVILWCVIVVVFFRWYSRSEREGDVLTWEEVEHELKRSTPVRH